jgi:5-methylcytosine-specific restriction endonuclease McrA
MKNKQKIREHFRNSVFDRDKYKCIMCGAPAVDAHHITDRNLMPNGGYVKENGVSLCGACHLLAEAQAEGFTPDVLYGIIGSTYEKAVKRCT